MCRCFATRSNGAPASGGGGGDASAFAPPDVDVVGVGPFVLPLATMPVASEVSIRSLSVALRIVAGGVQGDYGVARFGGLVMALNSPAAAGVVVWAPRPWGPNAGVPNVDGTQLIAPATFNSPGVPVVDVVAIGTQLNLSITGIGGLTLRATIRGNIDVREGAVRLVA